MSALEPALLAEYDSARQLRDPRHLCYAPFSNIYFNVKGQGAACWLTFFEAPRYPEHSIRDIWFGPYFDRLRGLINDKNLSERCGVCERNIRNRLFGNPLARAYDVEHPARPYPTIMELELSNACNLGCIMCNGRLSSTVRRERDRLPPQKSPYDDQFVEQLGEFIPHLEEARFNGGEPFLQKICWQAWDRIAGIKPSVLVTVATNGTVWNDRVKSVLERGNFRINLSLDGMSPSVYESIRRGSSFERVMTNIGHFGDHCRERGTIFSLMVNPMRPNWRELPAFVEFCNSRSYYLQFNTIYRPFHLALWTLGSEELRRVQRELAAARFDVPAGSDLGICAGNVEKYRRLVESQIPAWIREQDEREQKRTDYASRQRERSGSKSELTDKLRAAVREPAKLELALRKLSVVEDRVGRNVGSSDFYHHAGQLPLDWLLHDLEHKSVEEMGEQIYYRAEYY